MKILIDVDNTINRMTEHFVSHLEGLGYDFDWDNYDNYDMTRFILKADKKEQGKLLNFIFSKRAFWETIPVIPAAIDVVKWINTLHELDVMIATIPWKQSPEDTMCRDAKLKWLQKHFGFISRNQIVFEEEKWNLGAEIIIDDKPKILEKCNSMNMITIKKSQPYNKEVACDFSFNKWPEARTFIKNILK